MLDICGSQAVYIPADNCDDCAAFEARIYALEQRLLSVSGTVNTLSTKVGNKDNVVISKTDANGDTITATVLATVN